MYDCPVGIKTCLGQPEKIAPLKKGEKGGFCVADFGKGDEETECANLLLEIAQAPKQPPKKKPRARQRQRAKKRAKPKPRAKRKQKVEMGARLQRKSRKMM